MRINYYEDNKHKHINFPIPVFELEEIFNDPYVLLGNNNHVKWLSFMNNQKVNIYTLLHMFNRIDTYDDLKYDKLMALFTIAKPKHVGHVLAAVDAVETTALIRRLYVLVDDRLFAREVSRQLAHYTEVKSKPNNFIDYANEVKDYGLFETEYGYLLPIDYLSWYDNISEFYTLQEVGEFSIGIKLINMFNDNEVLLRLPINDEDLDLHINRIGDIEDIAVDTWDIVFSPRTQNKIRNYFDAFDVYELNELAYYLETLSFDELDKLESLLQFIELEDVEDMYTLVESLNDINFSTQMRRGYRYIYTNQKLIEIGPNVPMSVKFFNDERS